jgi:hypothetical protein
LKAVLGLLLIWIAAQDQRTGSIEGIVLRAATETPSPLVNARLELVGAPKPLSVVRTDASGRFVFTGLPPGRFRLHVTKDGFIRQEYPHAAMGAPGLPIRLSSGQELRDVVFLMEPARSISGQVRDRLNAPISDIVVQALQRGFDVRGNRTLSLAASTTTDDKGNYRLYWLDPGEYFISAIPPRTPATPAACEIGPTYFPGFGEIDDAKIIRLDSLRDANGLDFLLQAQCMIPVHGVVNSMATGRPVVTTLSLSAVEDGNGVARFQVRSTGESPLSRDNFTIPSVARGSYILSAVLGEERGAKRIIVRPYSRDPGVQADLELSAGLPVRGRFFGVPAGTDFRATRIALAEMDTALPQPEDAGVTEGTFKIEGVQPGYYSINVSGLPEDLYVKAAVFGGADALEKPLTVVRGPDPEELAIQLGDDGGRLAGGVFDAGDRRYVGAHVTLIPSDRRSRLDLYRTDVSREDGSFSLRGIAPGDYKLFAWMNPETNAYLNAEYMRYYEDFGTPVRIAPGENPPVSLRAIRIER